MGVPRKVLMASMTPHEFDEWCVYAQLNPFGPRAEEARAARICAVMANSMGGKKGGGQFKESDFMRVEKDIDDDGDELKTTLKNMARQK